MQPEFRFADIILPLNLPKHLTYGIPTALRGLVQPGMRVEVPLGRNKQYAGIVANVHDRQPENYRVKSIRNILDEISIVNDIQLQFWNWIANYYMASPGEVMQAALPAHLKLSGETRLQWMPAHDDVLYEWSALTAPAAAFLEEKQEVKLTELRELVGQKSLSEVIYELLEQEVAVINDALESPYRPKKERFVKLTEEYEKEENLIQLFDSLQRAPKQLELLMAYVQFSGQHQFVKQADLIERTGAGAAQIRALVDKGVFILEEMAVDRIIFQTKSEELKSVHLTKAQQLAYDQLGAALETNKPVLLQGVTGSGKTLLYIHKIREVLATGKQVLLLLPEIGLTTQLVARLYSYFGEELGVYHSRFSNNERVEIWEKVQRGKYRLVVGPRSAIWLPFDNLGLIVVDEEHDPSFKQKEPAPRFQARDAAIYLAQLHGADVILGSATPSVESLYNATRGKYERVLLEERYQGVAMPSIGIIGISAQNAIRNKDILSQPLKEAIQNCLAQNKQSILFQNRRGYSPFQLCTTCGWVPHCENCAVSLTYHKATDKLHCHYCGLKRTVIKVCPSCGAGKIISKSFGTEKIVEEVQATFPNARVARMDTDSLKGRDSLTNLLEDLEKHRIDILVGTQMVVKGLDFANVTLVGILSADSLLNFPDFRVNERAFQLMEQVAGRAGRTDGTGKVLIQVYNTEHPVLKWVQQHNVQAWFSHEIRERQMFLYPPFVRLIRIIVKHRDETTAAQAANKITEALQVIKEITIHGPAPALVPRIRNQYIQEVLIKCPGNNQLLKDIKSTILEQRQLILHTKGFSGVQIIPDVDPVF